MKDKISVIIPVYNVERYLKKCLDSVLSQTYKSIEIICINDGSTDGSLKILEEYHNRNSNIIIFSRENKGLLYTRVEGIKKATGKYITFLDSDDWIDENYIEFLYENLIKENVDLVRCNMRIVKSENIILYEKKDFDNSIVNKNEIYANLCRNYKYNNAVRQLFKRQLVVDSLGNIETLIALGEDLEFNLNLYKNINCIKTINYYGYNYRYNPSSITKNLKLGRLKKNVYDTIDVYYNLTLFTKKNNSDDYQISLSRMLMQVTNHLIRLSFSIELNYDEYFLLVNKFMSLNKVKYLIENLNRKNLNAVKSQKKFFNQLIYKRHLKIFSFIVWFIYKPIYNLIKKG